MKKKAKKTGVMQSSISSVDLAMQEARLFNSNGNDLSLLKECSSFSARRLISLMSKINKYLFNDHQVLIQIT